MVQGNSFVEVTTNSDVVSCPKCSKTVFMAEARVAGKFKWHANCFKCRKLRILKSFGSIPSDSHFIRRGLPKDIGLVELCRAQQGAVLQGLSCSSVWNEGLRDRLHWTGHVHRRGPAVHGCERRKVCIIDYDPK